jgi:hypothetical protein
MSPFVSAQHTLFLAVFFCVYLSCVVKVLARPNCLYDMTSISRSSSNSAISVTSTTNRSTTAKQQHQRLALPHVHAGAAVSLQLLVDAL